jgi:hypothetical protein
MRIYKGNQPVEKGTYWSPADGQQVVVREHMVLPGGPETYYLRIPRGGLLVIAPVFGLMYVFFLPLFGIGTVLAVWLAALVGTLTAVALTGIKICSSIVSRSVSFGWTPSSQYLSGKSRKLRRSSDAQKGSNPEGK